MIRIRSVPFRGIRCVRAFVHVWACCVMFGCAHDRGGGERGGGEENGKKRSQRSHGEEASDPRQGAVEEPFLLGAAAAAVSTAARSLGRAAMETRLEAAAVQSRQRRRFASAVFEEF